MFILLFPIFLYLSLSCVNNSHRLDRPSQAALSTCGPKDVNQCMQEQVNGSYLSVSPQAGKVLSQYFCNSKKNLVYCLYGCWGNKDGSSGICQVEEQNPPKDINSETTLPVQKNDIHRPPSGDWRLPEKYGVYLPIPAVSQYVGDNWKPRFNGDWSCGATTSVMVASYFGRLDSNRITTLENEKPPINPKPRTIPHMSREKQNFTYFVANPYSYRSANESSEVFNELKGSGDREGSGAWGSVSDGSYNLDAAANLFFHRHNLFVYGGRNHQYEDQTLEDFSDTTPNRYRYWLKKGCVPVLRTTTWGIGHFVVVKGVTPDDKIIVNDPARKAEKAFGLLYDNAPYGSTENALAPDVIRNVICDEYLTPRNGIISAPEEVTVSAMEAHIEIKFSLPEGSAPQPRIWGAYCYPHANISCWGGKRTGSEERRSDWGNGDGEVRFEVINKTVEAEKTIIIVSPYATNSPFFIKVHYSNP